MQGRVEQGDGSPEPLFNRYDTDVVAHGQISIRAWMREPSEKTGHG